MYVYEARQGKSAHVYVCTCISVNYQLSIRINDRHGSMRIDNRYYNKDYGLLAK